MCHIVDMKAENYKKLFVVKFHHHADSKKKDGWMDELEFYVPSTVFQSFRDDGRVKMKGSVQ